MSSKYRPSPFTSHPTVVIPDPKGERTGRTPLYRLALYVALVLALAYAVWMRAG